MSIEVRTLYSSANGDRWCLIRDPGSGRVSVRHEPNAASGGRATDIGVANSSPGAATAPSIGSCCA